MKITDEQCNEFRRLPVSFDDMVRAIHVAGMNKSKLNHLKSLAETDFDAACIWAEMNIESLSDYFDTWAKHCGASRSVFIGHTVRMLIEMEK